jgi:hypothetical protein
VATGSTQGETASSNIHTVAKRLFPHGTYGMFSLPLVLAMGARLTEACCLRHVSIRTR